jgi:hypothetical protein
MVSTVCRLSRDDLRGSLQGRDRESSAALGDRERNRGRWDDPRGLPWTSRPGESTVERFPRRVNGPENIWGATGAEAILPVQAAFRSSDERRRRHLKSRPCSPDRIDKSQPERQTA